MRKKINHEQGYSYPWLERSTVMCNQYYCYLVDQDFGPLFIKFSGYFPYTARICLNGHEYLKRQLGQRGIAYKALDNGVLCCALPQIAQQLLDGLTALLGIFTSALTRMKAGCEHAYPHTLYALHGAAALEVLLCPC